jgi:putative ABC transport system permease protein
VLAGLEPHVPLHQIAPLSGLVGASIAEDRFAMSLLATLATVALLLGGVGVFGVLSGEVTRRLTEIGLRMALGAQPSSIILMVLRRALACATTGVVAGGLLAFLLARTMASLLFEVAPADPVSFAVATSVVVGLTSIATLIPAVEAVCSSPLSVMREG